jgi:hypothetical protein
MVGKDAHVEICVHFAEASILLKALLVLAIGESSLQGMRVTDESLPM